MWGMILNFFKWVSGMTGMTSARRVLGVEYYDGPEVPIEKIEVHLLQHTGGSIDLKKYNDGIATVCINNRLKRNAITGKMMVDLRLAVAELERWNDGKAVILFGAGGTFCSGGDLQMAQRTANSQDGYKMATYMHHTLLRFQHLPLLSVAVLEGSGALGGGSEVALACDWRVSAGGGIGLVHARMGISPAWGGGQRLIRLLGRSRALDVMTRAKVFSPEEALALGLIDDILPSGRKESQSASITTDETSRINCPRVENRGHHQPDRNNFYPNAASSSLGRCDQSDIVKQCDSYHPPTELSSYEHRDERRLHFSSETPKDLLPDSATCNASDENDPQLRLTFADKNLDDQPALRDARAWLLERTHMTPDVLRALKAMCNFIDEGADERRIFAPLWGGPAQKDAIERKLQQISRKK